MSKRNLRQVLEWLYHPQNDAKPPASSALETEVMESYAKRFAGKRRGLWLLQPQSMLARTAVAVLLVAVLGVACELPTSAQVDLGQRIIVQLQPPKAMDTGARESMRALQEQLHNALSEAGAENVRIAVGQIDDRRTELDIVAWDEDLSARAVEDILREHIGADNLLTVNITALSGTISESFRHRVMRELFGVRVEDDSAEALRADILQRLTEQGFGNNARVEVLDDGSTRKITVEAESLDGSREIADEIIFERKEN